jgi:hypothetical protein
MEMGNATASQLPSPGTAHADTCRDRALPRILLKSR